LQFHLNSLMVLWCSLRPAALLFRYL
jgi:hypothetical protein